jgi:hypothetical protein
MKDLMIRWNQNPEEGIHVTKYKKTESKRGYQEERKSQ